MARNEALPTKDGSSSLATVGTKTHRKKKVRQVGPGERTSNRPGRSSSDVLFGPPARIVESATDSHFAICSRFPRII